MMCFGLKERKRSRTNHCVIVLLDDTQLVHELQPSSTGQDLLDVVIKHLNLLETSYFGLRYLEPATQQEQHEQREKSAAQETSLVWLDMKRSAIKQLRPVQPMTVYFAVKYYASDPCKLAEEITRYQFFLQCKQDILHGRLPVNYELAVELFALAVQSELGDFDPMRHQAPDYVSEFSFLAQQTPELERRVASFHRKLSGQVPATAELNFLERVKWLDLYGAELHSIQYNEEQERDEYALGLNPSGVLVLRNRIKVAQYQWARITKTKCQGRCFLMDVIEQHQQQVEVVDKQQQLATRKHRFGFRLVDKLSAQRLRWSFEDHKSFQFLIHNSTSLAQQQQHRAQLKFGQKFRYSIRSAMGSVRNANIMQQQQQMLEQGALMGLGEQSSASSGYHSLRHPNNPISQQQTKLRSSLKQHEQYGLGRPPPTVVRMPSRRLSNRSAAAFRANMAPPSQQQQHQATFYQDAAGSTTAANGNGLPMVPGGLMPGGHAATMVESQRQRALMMMMQQQQQHFGAQQANMKSQTLRPNMGKGEKNGGAKSVKAAYYEQLLMQQPHLLPPDVAIVPPGRHIMHQPTIYKSSSVINGLNQLAAASQNALPYPPLGSVNVFVNQNQRQQHQQPMTTGQQLFNGPPIPMSKYRQSRGHESPRSTKSAIAVSSALKLASKKLANQQKQQQLIYHQPASNDQTPLLLTYQKAGEQHSGGNCYYPVAYNLANLQQQASGQQHQRHSGGINSANVSPRSVRSARIGTHKRSKSTSENLHLLHQAEQQRHHQAASYAEHKAALLLSTVGPPLGVVGRPAVPPPNYNNNGATDTSTTTNRHQMIKRASIRPPANRQASNDDESADETGQRRNRSDHYCSRSDCSSDQDSPLQDRRGHRQTSMQVEGNLNWSRRRQNEFNGDTASRFFKQRPNDGVDMNNNPTNPLVKNIANKQATPILLTMTNSLMSNNDGAMTGADSKCNSSRANQLLASQRQQLQHHDSLEQQQQKHQQQQFSASKSSQSPASTSQESVDSPGVVDTPSHQGSSVGECSSNQSSPKYNNNANSGQGNKGPGNGFVQSALKGSTSKMIKLADSSHASTCGSANSATSGYYGGSQNSTGSASLDSDSNQHYRRSSSSNTDDWPPNDDDSVASPGGPRVTIGSYGMKPIPVAGANGTNNTRLRKSKPSVYGNGLDKHQLISENNNNNNSQAHVNLNNTGRYLLGDENNVSSLDEDKTSDRQKQNPNLLNQIQQQQQQAPASLKYVSFDV